LLCIAFFALNVSFLPIRIPSVNWLTVQLSTVQLFISVFTSIGTHGQWILLQSLSAVLLFNRKAPPFFCVNFVHEVDSNPAKTRSQLLISPHKNKDFSSL
jgi:hypothetical protein